MSSAQIKLFEAAREVLKSGGYFVDNLWHVDDVHFMCGQLSLPEVSNQEAMEVFRLANERFDGETGLSWPALEKALRTYVHRRDALKALFGEAIMR